MVTKFKLPRSVDLTNEVQLSPDMESHAWKAFPFPIEECCFLDGHNRSIAYPIGTLGMIHMPTGDLWHLSVCDAGQLRLSMDIKYITASSGERGVIDAAKHYLRTGECRLPAPDSAKNEGLAWVALEAVES